MDSPDLPAAVWRKSTYSNGTGGACVEVAAVPAVLVAVRDSKNPDQPALPFPPSAWRTFTAQTRLSSERIFSPPQRPFPRPIPHVLGPDLEIWETESNLTCEYQSSGSIARVSELAYFVQSVRCTFSMLRKSN